MIVATKLSEQAEQFEHEGKHYVGRRVQCRQFDIMRSGFMVENGKVNHECGVLFQLDDAGGLIFVDPSILKPLRSEPIPEPTK